MKRRRLALLGLLAWVAGLGAAPSTPTATAIAWVDQGRQDFQAGPLSAAVAVLGACAQDPVDGFDCAFQAARAGLYLSYVLALAGRPAEARNCLDPATHWARQAAADRPDSGQAHALLAEVYGRRVLLGGPMTALRYGPLNGAETAKALSLAPGDPAVLEAQGLRCLYAPALFGGDAAKAQACFERALAQKDSELTRYFLALALRERGMPERARQELLRAHALSPHNGLVNAALAGGPAG